MQLIQELQKNLSTNLYETFSGRTVREFELTFALSPIFSYLIWSLLSVNCRAIKI